MYVCYVQMCQVNKGETPRACPLYSLGQAGVIHWSFLLPPQSLLSYLICTSLSSPWAPYSTAFSKDIMVFSGPSYGRKGHEAFNLTVFSANIPFRLGKGPSKKGLQEESLTPLALCSNLIWRLCSSESMSLRHNKEKWTENQVTWIQVQSLHLTHYSCHLKSTPLLFQVVPRIGCALHTHAHLHSSTPIMLRPTMPAPLCPKKYGLGPNLSFS